MPKLQIQKLDRLISELWKKVDGNPFALIAISELQDRRDALQKELDMNSASKTGGTDWTQSLREIPGVGNE